MTILTPIRLFVSTKRSYSTYHYVACVLLLSRLLLLLSSSDGKKNIRVISPLRSLTIWDEETKRGIRTRRELFLEKFRTGLQAEVDVIRNHMLKESFPLLSSVDPNDPRWSTEMERVFRDNETNNQKIIERAYDDAMKQFQQQQQQKLKQQQQKLKQQQQHQQQKYQFVGIIRHPHRVANEPITWYARPKRKITDWTIRLIHVDRSMVLYDLYRRGMIDIYSQYHNRGIIDNESSSSLSADPTTPEAKIKKYQPTIASQYYVRAKSWKNLWNFSIRNMLTDSSGMFWRERRLPEGLYTDGIYLYESSYRYRDGRNGMHRLSSTSFTNYINQLQRKKGKKNQAIRERILHRLQHDTPDVVLEE